MIIGAHVVIYSTDAEADRAFLRDVLQFPHVDAGHGWLIFRLPPTEVAVHPSDENDLHELFLMTDDLDLAISQLERRKVVCQDVTTQRWGRMTKFPLPGGGVLGIYEPRHERP